MLKLTTITIASLFIANSAVASDWNASNDKGLLIYKISSADAATKLLLVCDPEKLWAAPEEGLKAQNYLNIQHNDTVLGGDAVTLSKGEFSGSFKLSAGSLFPANPNEWNKLIKELQTIGEIKIKSANSEFHIEIDKPISMNCNIAEN